MAYNVLIGTLSHLQYTNHYTQAIVLTLAEPQTEQRSKNGAVLFCLWFC